MSGKGRNNTDISTNTSALASGVSARSNSSRKTSTSTTGSGPVGTTVAASSSSSISLNPAGNVGDDSLTSKLNNMLLALETRLLSSLAEVENRLAAKIDDAVGNLTARLDAYEVKLSQLEIKCSKLAKENDDVRRTGQLSEAIIRGIPELPNEVPKNLLNELAVILNHELSPYTEAFRIKSKHGKTMAADRPVIVRFSCANERKAFLAAYRSRKQIRLRELSGFSSDQTVYINESLTLHNQHLLREALKWLKLKKLASVYTNNGIVHVKCRKDEPPIKLLELDQLTALVNSGQTVDAESVD